MGRRGGQGAIGQGSCEEDDKEHGHGVDQGRRFRSHERDPGELLEFWSDDYISDWEQDYLDRKAQELADDLDRKFGWADKYFNTGNAVEDDDGRTASSKALVPSLRTLRTS